MNPNDTITSSRFIDGVFTSVTDGVTHVKKKVKKLDEVDTLYIQPNQYNYAAMLQNTNYWQHYRLSADDGSNNNQRQPK